MRTSQGGVWCFQLLRALIGRARAGGLRGVVLGVAVASSLALVSVSPASTTSEDPVLAWGANAFGQLGNGTNTNSNVPMSVSLPAGVTATAVAAGFQHSLALTSTGQVLAWGSNVVGELGNGTYTNSNVAVSVPLPTGVTVTAVAAGLHHSLAMLSTGQVLAWGFNGDGELGNGTITNSALPATVSLPTGTIVTAIAAGAHHSVAVTSTGKVLAWGRNDFGQLGNGTTTVSNVPVSVSLPAGTTVATVAGGAAHSVAVTSTGQVLAWGNNLTGQLGNGTDTDSNVPMSVLLPAGTNVTAVATGLAHNVAVTSTGQVLAWGFNSFGQLGSGNNANSNVPVSTSLPPGTTVTAVSGGDLHSVAVTSAGQVLAWGFNVDGELGNGTNADSNVPVSALLPAGATVTAVAAGFRHSLALAKLPPSPTTTTTPSTTTAIPTTTPTTTTTTTQTTTTTATTTVTVEGEDECACHNGTGGNGDDNVNGGGNGDDHGSGGNGDDNVNGADIGNGDDHGSGCNGDDNVNGADIGNGDDHGSGGNGDDNVNGADTGIGDDHGIGADSYDNGIGGNGDGERRGAQRNRSWPGPVIFWGDITGFSARHRAALGDVSAE